MREFGLPQDITYWAPTGEDQYGQQTYAPPIIIKGRWEDRNEEVTTIGGEAIVSAAIVYCDRDLAVDGYLALGDVTAAQNPTLLPDRAAPIQAFQHIPDLRNVSADRKAVL